MTVMNAQLEQVADVWVDGAGAVVKVLCRLDGQREIDITLTPQQLLNLLQALHFADQQAEARRDKASSPGHATPHPFLSVKSTAPIELFDPDRVGVRLDLGNNSWMNFVLPSAVAQALRDQLDASLAAAATSPPAKH